ncbi:MAG TPA: hypothetical protein V6C58_20435 [Allocoleopsis sp.]
MLSDYKYIKMFIISIPLMFLTVSCGDSKNIECQLFIKIVNQTVQETKTINNQGKKTDSETLVKIAELLEKSSTEMSALKIKDTKLKELQTGFTNWYKDNSKATRKLVEARKKRNNDDFDDALKKLKAAKKSETELVNSINSYCGGK